MPDKTGGSVIGSLLNRPEQTGSTLQLPKKAFKDEDPLTRFMGGLLEDGLGIPVGTEPGGGWPATAGAALGALGPAKIIKLLWGAPKVATQAGHGLRSVMQPGALREFMPVGEEAISKFHVGTPTKASATPTNKIAGVPTYEGPGYVKSKLPQVEDAFDATGRLKPEIAAEQARLMSEMIDDPISKATFQEFAARDPLGAGHIQSFSVEPRQVGWMEKIFGRKIAGQAMPQSNKTIKGFPEAEFQTAITIDPKHSLYKKPVERSSTIAHEMQHASQLVKEGRTSGKRYEEANRIFGYNKNPYEIDANNTGELISKLVKLKRLSGR